MKKRFKLLKDANMAEINLDRGLSPGLEHSRPNSDHNLNPLRRGVFDKINQTFD
jgi:hypothetical protein